MSEKRGKKGKCFLIVLSSVVILMGTELYSATEKQSYSLKFQEGKKYNLRIIRETTSLRHLPTKLSIECTLSFPVGSLPGCQNKV